MLKLNFINQILKKFGYVKAEDYNNEITQLTNISKNSIQEEKLSLSDSLTVKNGLSNKTLLEISEVGDISEYHLTKIDSSNALANIGICIQQLPLVGAAHQLSNCYKVVMPQGAVGELMKYKNGMLGTPMMMNGKIMGHAGLTSIGKIATAPLMIFSVMSMVTGQYFMSKINKTLNILSEDIKSIINMKLDEKESENESIYGFYNYVRNNFKTIISNSDLKVSTITNIQSSNNKLHTNILFYEKTISRKLNKVKNIIGDKKSTKGRVEEINRYRREIMSLFHQKQLCTDLYAIGKVLEVRLSEAYDEDYCNNLKENCQDIINRNTELISKVKRTFINELNTIYNKAWINDNKVEIEQKKVNVVLNKKLEITRKSFSNIKDTVDQILLLNTTDNEFIYQDNELYLVERI